MKELDFINVIKNQIGDKFLGDDCAYLKELGIVISQDSLVEDVHFKRNWCTPFQLGYKSMAVNISDILAAGAEPVYATIALSLPNDIDEEFIKEFYAGAKSALHGAKIVGGDITGGKYIYISIAAIGKTEGRRISSRSHAGVGYKVITRGEYGLSAGGLEALINGENKEDLIRAHLEPKLDEEFANDISVQIKSDYAMMDTSDGLADALFKIAEASGVSIVAKEIEGMFGAEDYHLVAAVPEEFLTKLNDFYVVGDVVERQGYILKIGEQEYKEYDELGLYNHFGE